MNKANAHTGSARAAMMLWVLVLVALAYGVTNTFLSVLDLFTS